MAQEVQSGLVETHLSGGVLTLTQGGGVAHVLSGAMIGALDGALARAAEANEVRVVVLNAPGRIFCAGHDLKEIARFRGDADQGAARLTALFRACSAMMLRLATLPRPTIARVEGIATAAGLQLVASCDLAFAGQAARFCLPGVRNGGFCTTPAVAVGRRIGRNHLMELALSGDPVDALWAHRTGLVNAVLPEAALAGYVGEYAQRLAGHHGPALISGKRALDAQLALPLEAAYAHATEVMVGHFMDPARIEIERRDWGAGDATG